MQTIALRRLLLSQGYAKAAAALQADWEAANQRGLPSASDDVVTMATELMRDPFAPYAEQRWKSLVLWLNDDGRELIVSFCSWLRDVAALRLRTTVVPLCSSRLSRSDVYVTAQHVMRCACEELRSSGNADDEAIVNSMCRVRRYGEEMIAAALREQRPSCVKGHCQPHCTLELLYRWELFEKHAGVLASSSERLLALRLEVVESFCLETCVEESAVVELRCCFVDTAMRGSSDADWKCLHAKMQRHWPTADAGVQTAIFDATATMSALHTSTSTRDEPMCVAVTNEGAVLVLWKEGTLQLILGERCSSWPLEGSGDDTTLSPLSDGKYLLATSGSSSTVLNFVTGSFEIVCCHSHHQRSIVASAWGRCTVPGLQEQGDLAQLECITASLDGVVLRWLPRSGIVLQTLHVPFVISCAYSTCLNALVFLDELSQLSLFNARYYGEDITLVTVTSIEPPSLSMERTSWWIADDVEETPFFSAMKIPASAPYAPSQRIVVPLRRIYHNRNIAERDDALIVDSSGSYDIITARTMRVSASGRFACVGGIIPTNRLRVSDRDVQTRVRPGSYVGMIVDLTTASLRVKMELCPVKPLSCSRVDDAKMGMLTPTGVEREILFSLPCAAYELKNGEVFAVFGGIDERIFFVSDMHRPVISNNVIYGDARVAPASDMKKLPPMFTMEYDSSNVRPTYVVASDDDVPCDYIAMPCGAVNDVALSPLGSSFAIVAVTERCRLLRCALLPFEN